MRTAILLLFLAIPVLAQHAAKEKKKKDEKPEPAVYFEEDSEVGEGLQHVSASLDKGDTKGAAIWIRKLSVERGRKVTEGDAGVFVPVWRAMSQRMRSLPEAARTAYAELYEEEAHACLSQAWGARDLAALQAAAESYFPLLSEEEIGGVASALIEAGRMNAAEALLEELVMGSPDRRSSPLPAYALASLYARRGAGGPLAALAHSLSPDLARMPLAVGGARLCLDAAMRRVEAILPASPPACEALPGGGVQPLPPLREVADAPSWSTAMPVLGESFDSLVASMTIYGESGSIDSRSPGARAVFPFSAAVDSDLLFVHLSKSLFAFRLSDGGLQWTLGGERNLGAFYSSHCEPCAYSFYSIVAGGGRLVATLAARAQKTGGRSNLVCLRAADGKRLWTLDDGNQGSEYTFLGIPCLAGDRVFVGAAGAEKREQVSFLCVDASTGSILWKTHIASYTPPGEDNWRYIPQPVPTVLLDRSVLYVCSATGAFAALDPATGEFLWGLKYPCCVFDNPDLEIPIAGEWCFVLPPNPMLPSTEGIWFAPRDAPRFYLVDPCARSIRLEHRKDAAERYRFLVGCADGALLLGGQEVGSFSATEGLLHHWRLLEREGLSRPALAQGALLVPRARELAAIDPGTFKRLWSRPLLKGSSGDVLVSSRGIALVSPYRISFFPWK